MSTIALICSGGTMTIWSLGAGTSGATGAARRPSPSAIFSRGSSRRLLSPWPQRRAPPPPWEDQAASRSCDPNPAKRLPGRPLRAAEALGAVDLDLAPGGRIAFRTAPDDAAAVHHALEDPRARVDRRLRRHGRRLGACAAHSATSRAAAAKSSECPGLCAVRAVLVPCSRSDPGLAAAPLHPRRARAVLSLSL